MWVSFLEFKCSIIYLLLDFQHKITVQASPSHDRRRSLLSSSSSPPTSPPILHRLRAIQRENHTHLLHLKNVDSYCPLIPWSTESVSSPRTSKFTRVAFGTLLSFIISHSMFLFWYDGFLFRASQSLQERAVQPGAATQDFSRTMRTVRGRGPGRSAGPVDVAHRGSTALTPGERTGDINQLRSPLGYFKF